MHNVGYNLKLSEKIEIMKFFTSNPTQGTQGEKCTRRNHLNFFTPIYDHRESRVGDDVTLYYPGFQRFIDDADKMKLDKEDYKLAHDMCIEMAKYMNEKDKTDSFYKLLQNYFPPDYKSWVSVPGKSMADLTFNPCQCLQIEVKKEMYGNDTDSYTQIISYYIQSLKACKEPERCQAPGYLIELVGPHLFIYGAVYGEYVFVDRLVDPVWLVPQNEEAMIKIARMFRALKNAIKEIKKYYSPIIMKDQPQFPKDQPRFPKDQPRFPTFQSCYKGVIEYQVRIKRHMFKGILKYNNGQKNVDVVIKFTKRYCTEAHELMHWNGYAPPLIYYQERVEGTQYAVIVMEYHQCFTDAMHLDQYLKENPQDEATVRKDCEKALMIMNDHGFCHGNLTFKNIRIYKYEQEGSFHFCTFIINYKWAGRIGKVRYSFSANIPDGIKPGDLITKEREREQLEKNFEHH